MNKIIGIILFLTLQISQGFGQITDEDFENFDDAEFFFSTEDYDEALYLFLGLVKKFPDNNNFNFRLGMTYLNIPGQETKSIPYLEKAVEKTDIKYKPRDIDITSAPHYAWFYLGNAYRINNQPDKALDCYLKFQDIRNFEKYFNIGMVEKEVKATERAKIIQDNPVNLVKYNLGEIVNAGAKNYQPVVNRKETVMAFMQEQKFYNAIMFSSRKDGEWTVPQNITPQVGSDGDMLPAAFSDDGNTLLLVRKGGATEGDIYISKKTPNGWEKAVSIGKSINSSKDESHASFSPDGNYLVFCSDRRGGYGGHDIYISKRLDEYHWDEPVNMGPVINTEADESTAFLMDDGNSLYFTSNGHFNMGGYDIFFTRKDENGEWEEVSNLGYPLNTTSDNTFYQPVDGEKQGYLALFGDGNYGIEDIYKVEILPFTDPEVPENSMFEKDFTLILENEETGETIEVRYDRKTDKIITSSNSNTKYKWRMKKQ